MKILDIFFIMFVLFFISIAEAADFDNNPFSRTYYNDASYHIYTQDEMVNITSEALQKREDVKLLTQNFESWGWRQVNSIGVSQKDATTAAVLIIPVFQQKISTRGVNFHWEPEKNLTLRPDIDYYFNNGTTNYAFTVGYKF